MLPSLPDLVSDAPDCCNGIMCPMHMAQDHGPNCDMSTKDSGAQLKQCPVQGAAHYTAMIAFVLLAPAGLYHDAASEPAIVFPLNSSRTQNSPLILPRPDSC